MSLNSYCRCHPLFKIQFTLSPFFPLSVIPGFALMALQVQTRAQQSQSTQHQAILKIFFWRINEGGHLVLESPVIVIVGTLLLGNSRMIYYNWQCSMQSPNGSTSLLSSSNIAILVIWLKISKMACNWLIRAGVPKLFQLLWDQSKIF